MRRMVENCCYICPPRFELVKMPHLRTCSYGVPVYIFRNGLYYHVSMGSRLLREYSVGEDSRIARGGVSAPLRSRAHLLYNVLLLIQPLPTGRTQATLRIATKPFCPTSEIEDESPGWLSRSLKTPSGMWATNDDGTAPDS